MKELKTKFSYDKLWKLLIDRKIKKTTLRKETELSASTMAKLAKNGNVNTDVLLCICEVLKCDVSDILEIVK